MKKWVMIIDVEKCNNCNACALVVKDEYVGNHFPGYSVAQQTIGHSWFRVDEVSRGQGTMVDFTHIPTTCNHCENAPCIRAAGDGSVYKREDGIVIMDPDRTRGRSEIVKSCPYGMISWNEEAQVPQIWSFDAHLIDMGREAPRCVSSCPSGVFDVRKVTDKEFARMEQDGEYSCRQEKLKKTRPRLFYKHFNNAITAFIGGNIAMRQGDRITNVDGATVILHKANEGQPLAEQRTDIFGDFKFDSLPLHSGQYLVSVLDATRKPIASRAIQLAGESAVIDTIEIE